MQPLDAYTLLLVNAVFNGFAAAGWALLAGVFRMAPRASWLMVATHLCRVLAISCDGHSAGWPLWASDAFYEITTVATVGLLALAVRRMLRLGPGWRDIALTGGLSAAAIFALALAGERSGMLVALSVGVAGLGTLAGRDVIQGAGPGLARWVTALLVTPYLLLLTIGATRIVVLLSRHGRADPLFSAGRHASALVGSVWLVLTMAISVSLMALLVWRLVGRVEHLTRRDPMTNTLNRRAIGDAMQKLQALSERGHPFALILIDIDHFKRINDEFGHAGGDAALLHFVTVMRSCLRELDRLGRLGGEEFCALLPHTRVDAAALVAERMRAALQARPLAWRERQIAMTASFGVVAGMGNDPSGETALALADRQVYRAKDAGRNRVCMAREAFG